jgi:hypothetical protein
MIEEKRNYNETHPELREGEMFLSNYMLDNFDFKRIGWHSKRKGRQAYDVEGTELTGYIPVFVQKEEYDTGMRKYE